MSLALLCSPPPPCLPLLGHFYCRHWLLLTFPVPAANKARWRAAAWC